MNKLYEVIWPLLRDGEGEADEGAGDEEDFAEEQPYVGRVVPPLILTHAPTHPLTHSLTRTFLSYSHKVLKRATLNKTSA